MKKQIKSLLCFAFFALLWSNTLSSQSCMGVEVKVGSGYETASYNAKGKIQGTSVVTFKEIRTENEFSVLDIEIESKTSKGKSNGKTSYTAKCNSNQIIVDSKSMISDEQKQMLKDYEMTFTGKGIEIPANLKENQTLPDAKLHGIGSSSSLQITFDLDITNRKVIGKDKITIPMGTFEVFKISSDIKMKMVAIIPVSFEYQTISYIMPNDFKEIKTEIYRKGKLVSYSELVRTF